MPRIWMPVAVLAALTLPPPTQAQEEARSEPPALTLSQALARAARGHPELSAARHGLDAADAARLQAASRPNPELGLEVEDTRRRTRSTTLQLSQPVELGGKRPARVAAADRSRELAEVQLIARGSDIRAAVRIAFVDALIGQEQVRLAESSLQLAQRAADAAQRRVSAGKISPVEATRARVAAAGVQLELLQARSGLRTALQELAAAIGHTGPAIERVEGSLDLPPAPPRQGQPPVVDWPAYRAARLEVERQGALAALERAQGVPDLRVSLGVKRSEELGRQQAVIGVALPLPVFDRNRGAELEALRRQDQAADHSRALALRLAADWQRSAERLDTARARAEDLQRDLLPSAQGAYDAATRGFELGKFGFLDVLDAQRTLLDARAQLLRALADAHRAATEIERLSGAGVEPAASAAIQP
ncbi:TolC family protein [Aquabacterium sp. A7-Y]|uniref:TolC family protein n=1 Tax=Aquabacterium sp. A7-Y TaxID=1349605 RepID=UPI00223E8B86|nr:TolC family protein [Aquabacterium sp. A7-Y]MCW7539712.1 TolC family protein [Aquabacterium sp. A7-Y]